MQFDKTSDFNVLLYNQNQIVMKKSIIVILAIVGFFAIIFIWGISAYNGLVSKEQKVKEAVGNVEAAYQKRADLIPNVAATAKKYSDYESEAFKNIVEARAKATATTIDMSNLNAEQLANYQKVQDELMNTMRTNLNVIVERYPDLKANSLYIQLQGSLESCENTIAKARKDFNEVTQGFNTSVKRFPNNIIANWFGFTEKPYFEASEGSEKAPDVKELLQ